MNVTLRQRLFAQRRRTEAALALEAGKEDRPLAAALQPAGREVIQARTLYHGTSRFDLPAIQSVGLIPAIGSNTKNAQGVDKEAEVHLTSDPKIARKYGDVVLKVDTSHPEVKGFKHDPHEKSSVRTPVRIPPDAIQRIEARIKRVEARADALLKHRKDVSQRQFKITADKDTFNSLDKFFALLHHNPGHSGMFGMPFDGDGHQVFVLDPEPSSKYSGKDKGKYPDQVCVAENRRSTITHHSLITHHGYDQVMMTDSHRFGNVAQYLHPASGDQITLSKRFQKGRQLVRHTADPTDWTDRWSHVNGRTGETTSGHTLHSLYQHLSGTR